MQAPFQVTLPQVAFAQEVVRMGFWRRVGWKSVTCPLQTRRAGGVLTIDTTTARFGACLFRALCLFLEAEERMCLCFPQGKESPRARRARLGIAQWRQMPVRGAVREVRKR